MERSPGRRIVTTEYSSRQSRVGELLNAGGFDACIVLGRENLRYFCGFTGTAGVLVLSPDHRLFLTDSRYTTQARAEVVADEVREYKVQSDGLIAALKDAGLKKVGFEGQLAYSQVAEFREKGEPDWCWEMIGKELQNLRSVKSAGEVAAIEAAARLNVEAFQDILPLIRPGRSEREIALQLEFALKKRGAEEKAFDFIVASGARGALPHGVASDRKLEAGELVTIDFGCRVAGYHSDETVTLALGEPQPQAREIFDLVLAAHDRALAAVAPGVALVEIDRLARELIAEAGYGEFFGHGLGHGVGLDVHELPQLSPRSTVTAEEGMVFTVEPGIYLPGRYGVRIEDMVVVTAEGSRRLTSLPKQFQNLMNP